MASLYAIEWCKTGFETTNSSMLVGADEIDKCGDLVLKEDRSSQREVLCGSVKIVISFLGPPFNVIGDL